MGQLENIYGFTTQFLLDVLELNVGGNFGPPFIINNVDSRIPPEDGNYGAPSIINNLDTLIENNFGASHIINASGICTLNVLSAGASNSITVSNGPLLNVATQCE